MTSGFIFNLFKERNKFGNLVLVPPQKMLLNELSDIFLIIVKL